MNFVNYLYSNYMYVAGRKFAFYLRITAAIHSHVTKVYGSLFHFSTRDPTTRGYEVQSNKATLLPRNASCLLCSTKVGVQLCRNTGYNLNAARRHLHVKGEYSRLCYPVRTRRQQYDRTKVVTRTRGITHT